jgi:hypothetical protein
MIESLLRAAIDGIFRLTANSFEIMPSSSASGQGANKDVRLDHPTRIAVQLSPDMLKRYPPQAILEALQEFSFPEALALVSGLEPGARQLIFAALKGQHDLKSALEFGLQYENAEPNDRQAMVFHEVARHFLALVNHSTEA